MIVDIVLLIVLGIVCGVGLGFIIFLHFRNVVAISKTNTPEEFSLLAPLHYILIGFLGFCVTIAFLIVVTATELVGMWVKVLFGLIALFFVLLVFITTRYKVTFFDKKIVKQCVFGSRTYEIKDITHKRELSGGFCVVAYSKKGRAFSYNQRCIGSEYADRIIKSLPQLEI